MTTECQKQKQQLKKKNNKWILCEVKYYTRNHSPSSGKWFRDRLLHSATVVAIRVLLLPKYNCRMCSYYISVDQPTEWCKVQSQKKKKKGWAMCNVSIEGIPTVLQLTLPIAVLSYPCVGDR